MLLAAALEGHNDIVEHLIKRGCDLRLVNRSGRTVLMNAAIAGELELVDQLLDEDIDLNAVDKDGRNALDFALKYQHPDIAKLLTKKGLTPSATD